MLTKARMEAEDAQVGSRWGRWLTEQGCLYGLAGSTGSTAAMRCWPAAGGRLRPPWPACVALPHALQRVLLASLNGLAGLLLLQGLPAEAVKAYREALALSEWCFLQPGWVGRGQLNRGSEAWRVLSNCTAAPCLALPCIASHILAVRRALQCKARRAATLAAAMQRHRTRLPPSLLSPPLLTTLPFCPSAVDQTTLHVRADKLQQLHTLHNLAELLGEDGR